MCEHMKAVGRVVGKRIEIGVADLENVDTDGPAGVSTRAPTAPLLCAPERMSSSS